jgi:succinate dehydrogenase / fumarate reductase iron-sulfur subunit
MRKSFAIKIKRQDRPDSTPYWETFELPYEPGLNVTSCLQRIAQTPVPTSGKASTPVAFEVACLEEVCGSCTMRVNGRIRQACSALIDNLLVDGADDDEIVLEPMSKFPVQRDLFVDRTRMFDNLKKVKAWIPVDGYHHMGAGPRQSQADQDSAYPLSECMTCGCCVEACPQFGPQSEFIGPAAISQVVYFNGHPVGKYNAADRLEAIMGPGGITDCGNSQNCVKVCPKDIPLTDSIAKASRSTTVHAIRRLLDH